MPDMILKCGQTVIWDDEDYAEITRHAWFARRRPDCSLRIARHEYAGRRVFKVLLHREIALRMRPELAPRIGVMRVRARNGDYTDVRRSNLEVTLRPKAKSTRKPLGHEYRDPPTKRRRKGFIYEDDVPHKSGLWSGGVVPARPTIDGRRIDARVFAGRLIAERDGQGGVKIRGNHVGPLDIKSRTRRRRKRNDEVQLHRKNEGG